MTFLLLLWGCSGPPSSGADPLPPDRVGEPTALARVQPNRIALPASSRPNGAPAPELIPVLGPFTLIRTVDGVTNWEAPLPVRTRKLFFQSAPTGMKVLGPDGKALRFERESNKRDDSWKFTAETVILRLPEGAREPEDGAFSMVFPTATEREDALNFATAGLEEDAFVRRSVQVGEDTRTGLLLPAPASASWSVDFPANATLQLSGSVLPPETASVERSDGATLLISVDGEQVEQVSLKLGVWSEVKVDLSRWAGANHELTLATTGGSSDLLDYVFLAEPMVYSPSERPKRVLMVFLDTLRADHLSSYGYERDTSPRMAAWAEQNAVVFEQARSVAPWTLPTTRAILTGNIPEKYPISKRLPAYLAEQGWATGAFVGNIYLSSNFDMAQGWEQHGCVNWPRIEDQIPKVKGFVERHPDRDVLVMLHTMDMHLPYTEPRAYRDVFAGEAPGELGDKATRKTILKAVDKHGEVVQDWVRDRYDNNIRYTDDQLMDYIEALQPDVVVIFADHGEEFWEHGGFEHGHTLYDELLKVPILISAPGMAPGRVSAPVSNLDLTPTLLDLLDIPHDTLDGSSLVPLTQGKEQEAFQNRVRSVGRPLYGQERWGVFVGDTKWTSFDGIEEVFDLATDPKEQADLRGTVPLDPLRAALGEGLGTVSPVLWRLEMGKLVRTPNDVVLTIAHPDGFAEAWLGQDPLKSSDATLELENGVVKVTYHSKRGCPEIYLVPKAGVAQVAGLTLTEGGQTLVAPQPDPLPEATGQAEQLWNTRIDGRPARLFYAVAPLPLSSWSTLDGTNDEVNEALRALGYMEHEESPTEDTPEEEP